MQLALLQKKEGEEKEKENKKNRNKKNKKKQLQAISILPPHPRKHLIIK